MTEMQVSLFAFIQTYIKFFSSPEIQMETWASYKVDIEITCHEWIVNFLHSWLSIRNNLSSNLLINEIDDLHEKLTVYLKKIPKFQEQKVRDLHVRILSDCDWFIIQENSKMIFQQALKILD